MKAVIIQYLSFSLLLFLGVLGTNRFPASVNNIFYKETEFGIRRIKASNNISKEIKEILIGGLRILENANWRILVAEIAYALDERTRRKFSLLATYPIMPELGPFDKSYGIAMSFLKTIIKAGIENAVTLGNLANVVSDALIKVDSEILSEESRKIVRDIYHKTLSIALITALDDENLLGTNGTSEDQSSLVISSNSS
jgi:hypothetical protein